MARMIPLYSRSSEEEISKRARVLFGLAGEADGHDLDIWLQAENQYLAVCRNSHPAEYEEPTGGYD